MSRADRRRKERERAAVRGGRGAADGGREAARGSLARVAPGGVRELARGLAPDVAPALLAAGVMVAVIGWFAWLDGSNPELFYRSVQEDEYLEWTTFWAFIGASVVGALAAGRQWRGGRVPWFLAGVALFCAVVALEEISWGQRVLGFRAPEYFLANNYQQELTVHNVVAESVRVLGLRVVIVGYGMLLPLLALWPPARRLLDRLAIVPPTAALVPAFAVILALQVASPWRFSTEVVECLLGLGFLAVAVIPVVGVGGGVGGGLRGEGDRLREEGDGLRDEGDEPGCEAGDGLPDAHTGARRFRGAYVLTGAFALVTALGFATAAVSRGPGEEGAAERTRAELAALEEDLWTNIRGRGTALLLGCGFVSRLHTTERTVGLPELRRGRFADLVRSADPERARFFLDPWNMPYWLARPCPDGPGGDYVVSVYSFGPNRKRDSTPAAFLGDDLWIEVSVRR